MRIRNETDMRPGAEGPRQIRSTNIEIRNKSQNPMTETVKRTQYTRVQVAPENSKLEYRNSKQIRNANDRKSQTNPISAFWGLKMGVGRGEQGQTKPIWAWAAGPGVSAMGPHRRETRSDLGYSLCDHGWGYEGLEQQNRRTRNLECPSVQATRPGESPFRRSSFLVAYSAVRS